MSDELNEPLEPIPTWATAPEAEKLEPSAQQRSEGWKKVTINNKDYGEQPSYLIFNYMMFSYGEHLVYINRSCNELARQRNVEKRSCIATIVSKYGFPPENSTGINITGSPEGTQFTQLEYLFNGGRQVYKTLQNRNFIKYDPKSGNITVNTSGMLTIGLHKTRNISGVNEYTKVPDIAVNARFKTRLVSVQEGAPRIAIYSGLTLSNKVATTSEAISGDKKVTNLQTCAYFIAQQITNRTSYDIEIASPNKTGLYFSRNNAFAIPVSTGESFNIKFTVLCKLITPRNTVIPPNPDAQVFVRLEKIYGDCEYELTLNLIEN